MEIRSEDFRVSGDRTDGWRFMVGWGVRFPREWVDTYKGNHHLLTGVCHVNIPESGLTWSYTASSLDRLESLKGVYDVLTSRGGHRHNTTSFVTSVASEFFHVVFESRILYV